MLAAGRGDRMGGPKAMMDVGGSSWWMGQVARLKRVGVPATWVVSEEVRRAMQDGGSDVRLVIADPAAPMFTSIIRGLQSLLVQPPEGAFILPVDTPAPCAEVWQALAATASVAIPSYNGVHGHPVFLPWNWIEAHLSGQLRTGADAEGPRLDHMIAPIARIVPVSDPAITWNLNTPDDLARYLGTLGADRQ